ncbi:hypothetical protein BV898_07305 [Hypsibius exemplaris]|uniref:Uncharacterized protein n=1 Tax=Hypsibius exemplaris TaxID=2072580 RepID=A0A1W0WU01_HYPEX|nr:hypothetical protein BV898_07305 [Hypsibius exemplaris]
MVCLRSTVHAFTHPTSIEVIPVPRSIAVPNGPGEGYQSALRIGDVLYLSPLRGTLLTTDVLVSGGSAAEAAQALANVQTIVQHAGCGLEDIIFIETHITNLTFLPQTQLALGTLFANAGAPRRYAGRVEVLPRLAGGALVEFAVQAKGCRWTTANGINRRERLVHEVISIPTSVAVVAANQPQLAVRINERLKLRSLRGLDLLTSVLVPGGIVAESAKVIANVQAILNQSGCGLSDVILYNVRVTNSSFLPIVLSAIRSAFTAERAAVKGVADYRTVSVLANGASVELVFEAANCDFDSSNRGHLPRSNDAEAELSILNNLLSSNIFRPPAPAVFSPQKSIRVNHILKLSQQRGSLSNGVLVSGGVAAEAAQMVANVRALLTEAGCQLNNVLSIVNRVTDLANQPAVDLAWTNAFVAEGARIRYVGQVQQSEVLYGGALVETVVKAADCDWNQT